MRDVSIMVRKLTYCTSVLAAAMVGEDGEAAGCAAVVARGALCERESSAKAQGEGLSVCVGQQDACIANYSTPSNSATLVNTHRYVCVELSGARHCGDSCQGPSVAARTSASWHVLGLRTLQTEFDALMAGILGRYGQAREDSFFKNEQARHCWLMTPCRFTFRACARPLLTAGPLRSGSTVKSGIRMSCQSSVHAVPVLQKLGPAALLHPIAQDGLIPHNITTVASTTTGLDCHQSLSKCLLMVWLVSTWQALRNH